MVRHWANTGRQWRSGGYMISLERRQEIIFGHLIVQILQVMARLMSSFNIIRDVEIKRIECDG